MSAFNYKNLDPGIRRFVKWLNDRGYQTTDSGDGVTKGEFGEPEPHVYMVVSADNLVCWAHMLRKDLNALGVTDGQVQATYNPDDGVAMLSIHGVNDSMLPEEPWQKKE